MTERQYQDFCNYLRATAAERAAAGNRTEQRIAAIKAIRKRWDLLRMLGVTV